MNQYFYPNRASTVTPVYHGLNNSIPNRINIVPNTGINMIHGRRQLFSYEEDEQLKKLVEQFGDKDWKFIARRMPGRTTRQCRERYKNYLSPEIKNGPWTKEEDELLKEKYNEFGPHWSSISKFFKSRSDVNIKNRWSALSFHMNNDNKRNVYVFYPHLVQKKHKVLYPTPQNFSYQDPNSGYPRGCISTVPPNFYFSNMSQMINHPQDQHIQPHIISNASFTNINTSENLNNDDNEAPNDDENDISDDSIPPPINQPIKQQNNEIKNIINDSRNISVQPNSENSPISLSSVPMSVNFSGPLPPLLQKPKISLHYQQPQQASLLSTNSNADSIDEINQKRIISSPIANNQLNPNSPIQSEDNHLKPSFIQQDEERLHLLQQHIQPKEDPVNNGIPIFQIIGPPGSSNIPAQNSSSSIQSTTSSSSNQPLTIHKPQNQQHNQIKQTTVSSTPNVSDYLGNFPFPQSFLSTSLLNPSDQQESILASDARIDDASINTETEVLTNTFPNFGGRLW